jgi:hypothetical protein
MRRTIVAALMLAAVATAVAAGASGRPPLRLSVTPTVGDPTTAFLVSFTAQKRTGRVGSRVITYSVTARDSCGRHATVKLRPARKGQRLRAKLRPRRASWCAGTVRGKLIEVDGFSCPSICAGPAVIPRTLARFTFRVVAPGSDAEPPSFAGLESAVQCFPGPQTPGEQRPVSLSWNAATDNVSPGSKITYDIYMSATSGGENFSQPNWTTEGATSFTTPDLPAGRLFVVRARDEAGNEDHNAVERQAQNPCL